MTRVRTAVAVLAALLALVLPAPAWAASGPTWIVAPCATGGITTYTGGPDGRVSLAGWIQQCDEPTPDAGFAVMRYHENLARLLYPELSQMVQPYGSATAPTAFTVDYEMDRHDVDERVLGPLRAICVVRSLHAPVACVRIDRSAGGGAPLVAPLPVDDPRTAVPVLLLPDEKQLSPACGNCV